MGYKLACIFVISLLALGSVLAQGKSGDSGNTVDSTADSGKPESIGQPADSGNPEETGTGTQVTESTGNKGEESQLQVEQQTQASNPDDGEQVKTQGRTQVQSGNIRTESGKEVQVQAQGGETQLKSGSATAQTKMQMTQEETATGTKLQVQLSNGKNAEVKVMPDTASEKALEQLRLKVCSAENGCQIELKEVGQGDEAKAAYELKVERKAKVLGIFAAKMKVQAQVDAENGEVIQTKKPWWAFLASEPQE